MRRLAQVALAGPAIALIWVLALACALVAEEIERSRRGADLLASCPDFVGEEP